MKRHLRLVLALSALAVLAAPAWADEIALKSGARHSGKFVRGDANAIEFRVQGRIETYRTSDVSEIVFREPDLSAAPADPRVVTTPRNESRAGAEQPAREVPPQQGGPAITFPAGTTLTIRTTTEIDTDRNRVGDAFTATLDQPLMAGSQVVIPRGAEVKGRISEAKESGRLSGKSELALELTDVVVSGRTYIIRTGEYTEVGSSRGRRTAATAGGGAALGAIIGAIAGGGKGAAIGAGAGAAAGTGVTVLTKGQTLKVPAETLLDFRLQAPLSVTMP